MSQASSRCTLSSTSLTARPIINQHARSIVVCAESPQSPNLQTLLRPSLPQFGAAKPGTNSAPALNKPTPPQRPVMPPAPAAPAPSSPSRPPLQTPAPRPPVQTSAPRPPAQTTAPRTSPPLAAPRPTVPLTPPRSSVQAAVQPDPPVSPMPTAPVLVTAPTAPADSTPVHPPTPSSVVTPAPPLQPVSPSPSSQNTAAPAAAPSKPNTNPFAAFSSSTTSSSPFTTAAPPVKPLSVLLAPPTPPSPPTLNRPALPTPARPTPNVLQAPVRPNPPPTRPAQTLNRPALTPPRPLGSGPAQRVERSIDGLGLKKPNAPPMRVLEKLAQPEDQAPDAIRRKIVVVEEEEDVVVDDEEDGKKKKKSSKGAGPKRKEKVTAEMKRKARKMREVAREEKAMEARRDREEIFEVGDEGMGLEALAEAIQVEPSEIVRSLFMKGILLSMNQVLDKNTVKLVGSEYGLLVVDKEEAAITDAAKNRTEFVDETDIDDLVARPPVVTVMGHVDHGKTSLLDYIRKSRVAAGEAGGITQAIGAYNADVVVDGETKTVCLLDTPGHEAFSAMRARGAQVTDIVIIIVAADDGVRPQTREAVSHAQAAGVPIIVAINKIDKPGADIERTKQGLLELNLVAEEWGGSTQMVPISAKKGTGVDDLLQTVLWVAEEKGYMANPTRMAKGTIIEAHLDKQIGPVATLLVQAGTLSVGNIIRSGSAMGKVRSMMASTGKYMDAAGPSYAVQMTGLNATPNAGDQFEVCETEQDAREKCEEHAQKMRSQRFADMAGGASMVSLSSLASVDDSDAEAIQKLNLIIKGDTMGVVEAIKNALGQLPQQSVTLRYLLSGAGDITTSDIDLAAASGGLILGFNLNPDEATMAHAKRRNVKLMTYDIIYNLIDDIKAAMEGKLKAVDEKVVLGTAEVKALFGSGKKKVAGCLVTDGKLTKGANLIVKRGKTVVFTGKLTSLRRVKDMVDEVSGGTECGVFCDDFLTWQEGDKLECFQLVAKTRKLEDARASTAVDVSAL